MAKDALRERARRKAALIQRRRSDPRYLRTLGRFVEAGLLATNQAVRPNRERLRIDDVLWAGQTEPRFLELLPAVLVKRPSMVVKTTDLPDDLRLVVRRLQRNIVPPDFRGISGMSIYRWLPKIGRKDKWPARLKSFRLQPEDLHLLQLLSERFGVSETDVVRRGLRALL